MIPPVVASDRGRAQTAPVATQERCCRTARSDLGIDRNVLERTAIEGESPVREDNKAVASS